VMYDNIPVCAYTLSDVNRIVHPEIQISIIYSMMLHKFLTVCQCLASSKKHKNGPYDLCSIFLVKVSMNYSFNRRSVFPSIPIETDWTSFFYIFRSRHLHTCSCFDRFSPLCPWGKRTESGPKRPLAVI